MFVNIIYMYSYFIPYFYANIVNKVLIIIIIIIVEHQKRGKATRSAPYPQCHHSKAHGVYSIPKIVFEFVKV